MRLFLTLHTLLDQIEAHSIKKKIRIATESLSLSPSFNLDDFISSLISIVAILFSILMIALRFIFFVLYFISSIFYVPSALSVVWSTVYFSELFALLCFVVFFFSLILHNLFHSVAFAPLAKSFAWNASFIDWYNLHAVSFKIVYTSLCNGKKMGYRTTFDWIQLYCCVCVCVCIDLPIWFLFQFVRAFLLLLLTWATI